MAHQGRPGRDSFVSLEQHAEILGSALDHDVGFVDDTYGEDAIDAIEALDAGEILLLENTRMCDEELPEEAPEDKGRHRVRRDAHLPTLTPTSTTPTPRPTENTPPLLASRSSCPPLPVG